MTSDWEEFVQAAFVAAFALFAFLFLHIGDFSSISSTSDSLSNFLLTFGHTISPTGLSLYIDAVAALLTGLVSLNVLKRNQLAGLFVALFLYFFLSFIGNYIFVVS